MPFRLVHIILLLVAFAGTGDVWGQEEGLASYYHNRFHGRKAASISLKKEGEHCIFTVKNIVQQPIQYLDKLTNRFYSENLSSSEESSGLGLYITQQLVEILGGDLTMKVEDDWFELRVSL